MTTHGTFISDQSLLENWVREKLAFELTNFLFLQREQLYYTKEGVW